MKNWSTKSWSLRACSMRLTSKISIWDSNTIDWKINIIARKKWLSGYRILTSWSLNSEEIIPKNCLGASQNLRATPQSMPKHLPHVTQFSLLQVSRKVFINWTSKRRTNPASLPKAQAGLLVPGQQALEKIREFQECRKITKQQLSRFEALNRSGMEKVNLS